MRKESQAVGSAAEPAAVSVWSWAAAAVILALVVWQNAARFEDPVGEKLPIFMKTGSADFAV